VGTWVAASPKGSRIARKSALDTENGQEQASRMSTDKEQFSGNRDCVKGNPYHFED
jgi:hypothetical protein